MTEEWDWPPRRLRKAAFIDLEAVETARSTHGRLGWDNPLVTRTINAYGAVVFGIIRVLVSIALTGIVLFSAWLIGAIIKG